MSEDSKVAVWLCPVHSLAGIKGFVEKAQQAGIPETAVVEWHIKGGLVLRVEAPDSDGRRGS